MKTLEGFLGIRFGASIEDARSIIEQRANCVFDETNSTDESLIYYGINFGGRDTLFILLFFYENSFSKASVYIEPKLESQVVSLYQDIKAEINERYYESSEDFETYTTPYEKNDGYTETAISLGKANFSCFWSFTGDKKIDDYISLRLDEELRIIINYENGYLTDLLIKKNKSNNISDY
ncbi:hypothetical protein [Sediminibacterium sp.]|uniref:hypothetical protein n=1 Tax=Sediminibacterium sp. TaxID=1917865 RepID=UPI003F6F3FC6